MISINSSPERYIPSIPFPVVPRKDESLQSWLARKNHQREYYAEVDNPKYRAMKPILSKGTKVIFNNRDFGALRVESRKEKK